jgi:hypothetical protein
LSTGNKNAVKIACDVLQAGFNQNSQGNGGIASASKVRGMAASKDSIRTLRACF